MSIITGKTLLVNSIHRLDTSTSTSNFEVDLSNPSVTDTSADVVVRWISIPFTVYNVNEHTKSFRLQEDAASTFDTPATNFDIVLTEGNYTGSQLASTMETAMNAVAGNTYSVSYDNQTAKFTFDTTAGTDYFRFAYSSTNGGANYAKGPCRLTGFVAGDDSTAGQGGGSALVSDVLAQLQPCNSVELRLQGFFNGQTSEKSNAISDILLSIQALVPFGYILNGRPTDSAEAYHVRQLFSNKKFRLTTDFGQGLGSVDLPLNGSNWQVFMAVREYRGGEPQKEVAFRNKVSIPSQSVGN